MGLKSRTAVRWPFPPQRWPKPPTGEVIVIASLYFEADAIFAHGAAQECHSALENVGTGWKRLGKTDPTGLEHPAREKMP